MLRSAIRPYYVIALLLGTLLLPLAAHAQEPSETGAVDLVEVTGYIDPPMVDYIRERVAAADSDGVESLILQIDSPGGFDVPTLDLVRAMLDSKTPITVWIAPRGARASSSAAFLATAGDLVFMADQTSIGPAMPVDLGRDRIDSEAERRDVATALGQIAEERGRDANVTVEMVWDARRFGTGAAIDSAIVDGTASSLGDLLRGMDGREVGSGDRRTTLETWDESVGAPSVTVRFQELDLFARLLHAITGPEVAFALLLIGLCGLIFELYNPGIGLAGLIGAACIAGAFYALSVLPVNWAGVVVVVAGIVMMLVDLHTSGFGLFTFVGLASIAGGGVVMFLGTADELRLGFWALVAAVVGTLLFFVSVMTAALRVRLRRPIVGEEGIVGSIGEARTDIAPEGTVFTKGTLWRARTMETGIAAGSKVEIKATEGLVLLVEPLHEHD
jgi:membrane-bound serine protease (ClpP class)